MAMQPMKEEDGALLQQLEFGKHFPPSMTDGQWRNVPNEFGAPVFQLIIKNDPPTNLCAHWLSQMVDGMNFDAEDAAWFDINFDNRAAPVIQIAFMDTAAFPSVVPALNQCIAGTAEMIIRQEAEQERGFAGEQRPSGPLPPTQSGDRASRDMGRARPRDEEK